jgi:predicted heme/steroid binding protein
MPMVSPALVSGPLSNGFGVQPVAAQPQGLSSDNITPEALLGVLLKSLMAWLMTMMQASDPSAMQGLMGPAGFGAGQSGGTGASLGASHLGKAGGGSAKSNAGGHSASAPASSPMVQAGPVTIQPDGTTNSGGAEADPRFPNNDHPDFNLMSKRGINLVNAPTTPVQINGDVDPKDPPQAQTMFFAEDGNPLDLIANTYSVNGWDWNSLQKTAPENKFGPVGMLGIAANEGQAILVPHSGYTIDGKNNSKLMSYNPETGEAVLFSTRDNKFGGNGYAMHVGNIDLNPNIKIGQHVNESTVLGWARSGDKLSATEKANVEKKGKNSQIYVAYRDTGQVMDPRHDTLAWRGGQTQKSKPAGVDKIAKSETPDKTETAIAKSPPRAQLQAPAKTAA